jgi:catechol 2,3-dioxygenase-like lactoylglutathione lyase family enzyme
VENARELPHRRERPGLGSGAGDRFLRGKLGLKLFERGDEQPYARFAGAGETKLGVYESGTAGQSRHTLASFVVDDVRATVRDLRASGVTFEEYDMPGIKTEDGVATMGDTRTAWLKDPDGNILEIAGG